MADDQPTPDAPKPTPRGAGFDDDEWVRRDLGPRPEVPNHGRRPVLMGIPILLITIAAVVAILVAGCGDDEPAPAGGSGSAPAAGGGDGAAVEQALEQDGDLLAGRLSEAGKVSIEQASCEPLDSGAGDFSCSVTAGARSSAPSLWKVRLQGDGTASKLLAGQPPASGDKTSESTAALLVADDANQSATPLKYVCATSTTVNPDGSSTGGMGSGQRCVGLNAAGKVELQRYVEFAPDGAATRDFLLPDEQ